jgi:hypothetical protein
MANNFFESLKKDFLKKAIYDIAKFALILIITFSSSLLVSNILVLQITSIEPYKYHIGVLLGAAISLLLLVMYRKFGRYRPNFPRLDFDFTTLEREISYEYLDKTHMIYKKRTRIKSLKNGLDTYRDRYRWTGRGKIVIKTGIPEQKVVETARRNVWYLYEIRLQKTLKKGDSIDTEVIWELEDLENKAVPFFSATMEEPTDLLKLNLSLPTSFGVREVTCETSSSIGSRTPFDSFTMALNKHGEVSWEIKNPKLLYHYEIKWTMN